MMRTKILIAMILLFSIKMFSQTPSINQTRFRAPSKTKTLEADILKKLDEKAALEKNTNTSTESVSTSISEKEAEIATLRAQFEAENAIANSSKAHFESHFAAKTTKVKAEITQLDLDFKNAYGDDDAMDKIEKKKIEKLNELKNIQNEKEVKMASFDGHYKTFFPSVNKLYRQQFFKSIYNKENDNTKYVNSFALSTNKDGSLAQSEIVTDNLSALRISFGSVISSPSGTPTDAAESQKETENEAVKRLIGGGGNFYLELDFPLITTNNENEGWITFYSYSNLIGASDIKGFGNNLPTSSGNGSIGISNYLGATSDSGKFNFFIQGNINYTMGSNDFYTNLGLKDEKGFLNGKLIAGVTVLNTFRLSAIISTYGSDEKVRSGNVIFGVQILPSL